MTKYKTIHEDIETLSNKEVVKKTRISVVAVSLIVVAVLLAVIGMGIADPNASLPSFLFTLSVLLLLGGIVKLFVSRSCYMFLPTKSRLKPVTLYFNTHESQALVACMEMKRFDDLKRMKKQADSGVKLDAMIAQDQKFVAVQLSEYVPYVYEAITPVMCYYGDEAKVCADSLR